jgi:hypothetical protein
LNAPLHKLSIFHIQSCLRFANLTLCKLNKYSNFLEAHSLF